jgi:sugar-specific transcriptional regulator TrmB
MLSVSSAFYFEIRKILFTKTIIKSMRNYENAKIFFRTFVVSHEFIFVFFMRAETILQNQGLSEKQAKVYLACLELGSASVQKVARQAGLARSTVYELLETLRLKGFVSTFLRKHIRYFSAQEPEQIVRLAQRQVDSLKHALPQLEAVIGESRVRPTVRFYQGQEQMKIILEEVLDEAEEMLSFSSVEDLFRELGDYFYDFVKRRVAKKIPARVLALESKKARERQERGLRELRTIKILPLTHNFHGQTIIWKNKIALFSFIKDFTAIVVESKELAEMQRAMFNNLWERAG